MKDGFTCIGRNYLNLEDIGNRLILEETLTILTVRDIPNSDSGESLANVMRSTYNEELGRMRGGSESKSKSRIAGNLYISMDCVSRIHQLR